MRMIGPVAAALVIGACASPLSAPPSAPAPARPAGPVAELPAQRLHPNDCGVFLFERRPPNRFVFFEDLSARTVKILHEGAVLELGVTEQSGALVTGESFRRVYLDAPNNRTFILTGEVGEDTGSGPRLEAVLLTVQTLDGGRVVRPLGGVRSCRDGEGGPAAS